MINGSCVIVLTSGELHADVGGIEGAERPVPYHFKKRRYTSCQIHVNNILFVKSNHTLSNHEEL